MKIRTCLLGLSAAAAAVLAACGGGGMSAAVLQQPASVAVQTYITDNLATEYSKVWVSIEKITVVDANGVAVTLLDATGAPVVVNLSSLADVGQFMSTVNVPAGLYTGIDLTLANAVQLVSLDGLTTTDAKFSPTGTDFDWHVRHVSIDATGDGQVVLDFNLAKFSYDAATGLVTPTLDLPHPGEAFRRWVRQQAEVHGTVAGVDTTAGTLTINDARLGQGIVVSLTADAVIVDEHAGTTLALAALTVGQRVEIKGTVTPGATTADPVTVQASVIHVEPTEPQATAPRARGAGTVVAVSGTRVTVALAEANFLPGADSVVVDIADAHFLHGQASDLSAGVGVAFGGTLSGTGDAATIIAKHIDVRGAPSAHEHEAHPERRYSGVNGDVATLASDGSFTVTVTQSDGPFVVPGTYSVDPTLATYTEGSSACLVVGAHVKAVGSLTGTALAAKFIDIDECSGQPRAEPPAPPASAASSGT